MNLRTIRIRNYRRLRDVHVDLDPKATIFVGSNNSGKTSATHIFQAFLGSSAEKFSIHDFTADCWADFDQIGTDVGSNQTLPSITLDLWFDVGEADLHRIIHILPSLEWDDAPVGVRLQYTAKDPPALLQAYRDAHEAAKKYATGPSEDGRPGYHPWPESLTDYLRKRLSDEFKIHYYVLDRRGFDDSFQQDSTYEPHPLGTAAHSGAKLLSSLLRVDFMTAQRHLSDSESRGRAEDLSKRLSRFYERNLQRHEDDHKAVAALATSEAYLNEHLSAVFDATLKRLNNLGYPGFADPHLVIKSAFDPESILTKNASVHYQLRPPAGAVATQQYLTLPDKYNGLGFKNLIYMVIEILDFHYRWAAEEVDRPPLHLVVIEEPEAHLHAQLQQVFIRNIQRIPPEEPPEYVTQLIVTTHSPHIIYESSFTPIRYFRRSPKTSEKTYTDVLNLSRFYDSEVECREFLRKYMKLTHCDLFFADAAILVEGNVERLLLPLMISRDAPQLESSYLSVLELGGAFAHMFKTLISFLGITTLVITDLDSVHPPAPKDDLASCDDIPGSARGSKKKSTSSDDSTGPRAGTTCMPDVDGAVTSNQTLRKWIPKLTAIKDLLAAEAEAKSPPPAESESIRVRVAYQTLQPVEWSGEKGVVAGRTFEEAFALQNLDWCQKEEQKALGLRVVDGKAKHTLHEIATKVHDRVKTGFDKTEFALILMLADSEAWKSPAYIADGLQWLATQLSAEVVEPVFAVASGTEVPET